MGDKSTAISIANNNESQIQRYNGQKKKRPRFGFFKTAMVLLRSNRPNKKTEPTKIANVPKSDNNINNSDGNWKRIVGSMRPLHLQDSPSSPTPPHPAAAKAVYAATPSEDGYFSASPAPSTSSWSTMSHYASTSSLQDLAGSGKQCESPYSRRLSDNMSRYASALNLHDLDVDEQIEEDVEEEEEEENDDNVLEKYAADNMIDSKADEFIAKFYDQMRNQKTRD